MRSRESVPAVRQTTGGAEEAADPQRQEILRLEAEIDRGKTALGLAPPPPDGAQPQQAPAVPGWDETQGLQSCDRTCRSSSSICDASRRICRLADEMDDDWAAGRCTIAARTCGDARRKAIERCRTCG
jgi:hypothetical protein